MAHLASLELVVAGFVLVAAATAKAVERNLVEKTSQVYLLNRLGARTRTTAWYVVAVAEAALAAVLLLTRNAVVGYAIAIFFGAATVYLGVARLRAPESACGCFGVDPGISTRAVVRGIGLTLLTLYGAARWPGAGPAFAALGSIGIVSVQLLAVGASAVRIPAPGSIQGALLWARTPRCLTASQTPYWALASLRRTGLWEEASRWITATTPDDHWREGCWRFLSFAAKHGDVPATIVFAVHLPPGARTVRASLVAADGSVAWSQTGQRRRFERITQTDVEGVRYAFS